MSTIATVEYNNLVSKIDDTEPVVLASGTAYTAGMILVKGNDGLYRNDLIMNPEDTPAGTQLPFSEQKVYVLSEDTDATLEEKTTIAYCGMFNRDSVSFLAPQLESEVAGTLQSKNIILENWSKK